MKTFILIGALCAAAAAGIWTGPARAAETPQARELAAGPALPDGTVAGEKEAYDYFKANEPELYAKLRALGAEKARSLHGKRFAWFQRVGNYRKRQKAEMIRQIKAEFLVSELSASVKTEKDPARKADLSGRLRAALTEQFDSDLSLLEWRTQGLEQEVDELRAELESGKKEIEERRRAKEAIVSRRLLELTEGK